MNLVVSPLRFASFAPRFGSNADGQYKHLFKNRPLDSYATSPWYENDVRNNIEPDDHVLDVISDFVKPGEAILELGCHNGNNLVTLGKHGYYPLYGVDLSQPALDKLTQRAKAANVNDNVYLKQWDFAENGDLPPKWGDLRGKLKAIYAVHVLSHLSAPVFIQTMQKLQRYLTPAGIMLASILDPDGLQMERWWSGFSQMLKPHHRLNCGYVSHTKADVEKAFKGLHLIPDYSRPFRTKGEVRCWDLPVSQLRWVAYQKPNRKAK